ILPGLPDAGPHSAAPHVFHVVVCFALAAALIVAGLLYGPEAEPDTIDGISSGALMAYLLASALVVVASGHASVALIAFALLTAATGAIAWRAPSSTGAVPAAAALAVLVIAEWAVYRQLEHLVAPSGPTGGVVPEPVKAVVELNFMLGAAFAALFGAAGFL